MGRSTELDRLDTALRAVIAKHGIKGEAKWNKLSAANLNCYKELVDTLMSHMKVDGIKYRQMFLDRSYVWKPLPGEPNPKDLDTQFKLYYQYIKHHFGIQYLPFDKSGTRILVRLDNHSSQAHKDQLVDFAEKLPLWLDRADLTVQVTFINSAKSPRLQICDILMGAAGSHGNKMQLKRKPGHKGMTPKQKLRHELCKHVYEALKRLDHETRGSRAFNWFESTGHDGDIANRFHHILRIWKFVPDNCVIDRGWQNDHLDKQGNYIGPDIV